MAAAAKPFSFLSVSVSADATGQEYERDYEVNCETPPWALFVALETCLWEGAFERRAG
jgi:hypothetical protein